MSEDISPAKKNRRDFIKTTAAVAGMTVVAPGVLLYGVSQAKPADEAVTSEVRWGMLIDTTVRLVWPNKLSNSVT